MPYPRDPKLEGLAAVTFRNTIPPHELDHPATDPRSDEVAPLPTWRRWKAMHPEYRAKPPPALLPTAQLPQGEIEPEWLPCGQVWRPT